MTHTETLAHNSGTFTIADRSGRAGISVHWVPDSPWSAFNVTEKTR